MSEERDELIVRRNKLEALRESGFEYPNDFRPRDLASDLHERHLESDKQQLEELGVEASVAGRILSRRLMGKASFVTLQDRTGQIQGYIRSNDVGSDQYDDFSNRIDIGDIVGIEGTLMRTNRGELSIQAVSISLLTKSLRPLPEKFHGLADTEIRYRQRYLDLMVNPESRQVFLTRSKLVKAARDYLESHDYIEVETPMMHPIPGGAVAAPFKTHHNALDMDLFLRVAPELYLKRLVVGGLERVYEINRNFRNEGVDTKHNPEFTMLEFYESYATYLDMQKHTVGLIRHVAEACTADPRSVQFDGSTIDFAKMPESLSMQEAVAQHFDVDVNVVDDEQWLQSQLGSKLLSGMQSTSWGYLLNELFEMHVEPKLVQPTFIRNQPVEISPLARRSDADPRVTDRFELFIAAREIANAFSELNDPDDQRQRFEAQVERLNRGDSEAMHFDQDYIRALEIGMPPTGGEGVGIDRLAMLLTDSPSIRDVLLFPHMRHET